MDMDYSEMAIVNSLRSRINDKPRISDNNGMLP